MRILCVDVGTGTQDIFLYDSQVDLENGFKLVVPAPTMMVHRRLKEATRRGDSVLLTGVTMGGGPSQWAAEAHIEAGHTVFAAPDAARSFNDDLDEVAAMGIQVVGEDEAANLPDAVIRLELRDFDFAMIARALAEFGVGLDDLAAVAVAVFDHGNAPPGYSDRQFRFDYITEQLAANNRLGSFAFPAAAAPEIMTRMQGVISSAQDVDAPLVLMDTAPAAVLGALQDPVVRGRERVLIANVGNFHTLAFRLGADGVEGVFEHHTGLLNQPKLEGLLRGLADGNLKHKDVFNDHGHGALITENQPLVLPENGFGVAVTGPRRKMMEGSGLRPYFATPFGDMMIAGCFGLLAGIADAMPELRAPIAASLQGQGGAGTPPWELA
ncbi:MAG: DUF1786 domain-containing protein [Chloroflexi bacterium]|nr:DUF1786 domain-containing protein [Chloroflexota bacterium]